MKSFGTNVQDASKTTSMQFDCTPAPICDFLSDRPTGTAFCDRALTGMTALLAAARLQSHEGICFVNHHDTTVIVQPYTCSPLYFFLSPTQPLQKQPVLVTHTTNLRGQIRLSPPVKPSPKPSPCCLSTMPQKHSRNNTDRAAFTYQEKQMVG